MISKELLSEVLSEDIEHIYDKSDIGENYICYMPKLGCNVDINIYELAHKCKEWATKHNFHLVSWTISYESVKNKGYCQTHNTQDSTKENDKPFRESTEIEAIFKACQWILDNKDG